MKSEKQVVYVPDLLVREARDRGMLNLSRFVREKLVEFNAGGRSPNTYPDSTSNGGQ